MFILKAKKSEPMIIGDLGIRGNEGIFIEIDESDVPKKYRIEHLGGAAVVKGDYMRSNTYGITSGKYFKKVSEPLDFEPIEKEKLEELRGNKRKYDLNKILKTLEELNFNDNYSLTFQFVKDDTFELHVSRTLKDYEIEVTNHEYIEYKENFNGMYDFSVHFILSSLTSVQVKEIKDNFNDRRIKTDLNSLKNIITKYNLYIDENNYIYSFYSKYRTGFNGKNSENIDIN